MIHFVHAFTILNILPSSSYVPQKGQGGIGELTLDMDLSKRVVRVPQALWVMAPP